MTIYDDTKAFDSSSAGVAPGNTNPSPAGVGGSTSYYYSTAAAGTFAYQRWNLDGSTAWRFRRLVYIDTAIANSSTDLDLVVNRISNDTVTGVGVRIQGANKLRIVANGGAFPWTSTVDFPVGAWYRLEGYGDAAAGTARVALFPLGSTTPVTGLDSGLISVAQGGVAPSNVRVGKASNATGYAGKIAWDLDDYRTGADAPQQFIGPYSTGGPSATAPASQSVTAGGSASVTVTATGSSPFTYAWSVLSALSTSSPTLTGATTATVAFTAPAAGNLVTLQCVVTDSLGQSTTVVSEVRVPVDGSVDGVPIIQGSTSGTWNIFGGSASIAAALADNSDTTYVESGTVSTTAQTHRERWAPSGNRASASLTRRLATDTGTATATLRLYEGGSGILGSGTLRKTWTQPLTTTITDYTFAVDSTTVSAISDWGGLWVELDATA